MSWNDLRSGRFSQEQGEYFITFNTYQRDSFFNDFELACLFCRQIALNEQRYQCTWLTVSVTTPTPSTTAIIR